jgi:hypothetical protein
LEVHAAARPASVVKGEVQAELASFFSALCPEQMSTLQSMDTGDGSDPTATANAAAATAVGAAVVPAVTTDSAAGGILHDESGKAFSMGTCHY